MVAAHFEPSPSHQQVSDASQIDPGFRLVKRGRNGCLAATIFYLYNNPLALLPAAGGARKTPQGFRGSKGHHPVEKWWLIALLDLWLSRAMERDGAGDHCSQIITGGSVTYWVRRDRTCCETCLNSLNKQTLWGKVWGLGSCAGDDTQWCMCCAAMHWRM